METKVNKEAFVQHATGAVRENKTGKGKPSLIPWAGLAPIAKVYEDGAAAHGARNWEKGMPVSTYVDSAIRHLMQANEGLVDEPHIAQAGWNIICALATQQWAAQQRLPSYLDDMPRGPSDTTPWVGVDFDGTLAKHGGWGPITNDTAPILPIFEMVQSLLKQGVKVKIMTARACCPIKSAAIEQWCLHHLGTKLEVTNKKDGYMVALYDDLAVAVERDTGKLLSPDLHGRRANKILGKADVSGTLRKDV